MEPRHTASGEQRAANTEEPGMPVADHDPAVYEPREVAGEPSPAQEEWTLLATGDPASWLI